MRRRIVVVLTDKTAAASLIVVSWAFRALTWPMNGDVVLMT
jgi:hypothetical protein